MNVNPDTALAMLQAQQGQESGQKQIIKGAAKSSQDEKLDAVAQDFEAMFVTEMMKPMFEGVKPNAMFGGGKGEEIFQGLMLQEYGKMMAETGQLGIADAVKQELINMQAEAANGGRR